MASLLPEFKISFICCSVSLGETTYVTAVNVYNTILKCSSLWKKNTTFSHNKTTSLKHLDNKSTEVLPEYSTAQPVPNKQHYFCMVFTKKQKKKQSVFIPFIFHRLNMYFCPPCLCIYYVKSAADIMDDLPVFFFSNGRGHSSEFQWKRRRSITPTSRECSTNPGHINGSCFSATSRAPITCANMADDKVSELPC